MNTHYINGQWQAGESDTFTSVNPATGEILWQGQAASIEQITAAVAAANTAKTTWTALSFKERLHYIEKFKQQLEQHREMLTEAIAQETGKPLWESSTEVGAMIGKLAISISAYEERSGYTEKEMPGAMAITQHKPHGVMIILGPYNFPGHLPNGHIIPALLAGNTVVFKPSELTPMVAEKMLQCWDAVGLPPGVVNLVQGGGAVGQCLIEQEDINGVLFTGSYATGKRLHEHFAGRPEIMLALEMGGNNPLIVWDVADYIAVAYHTIQSAFITAGQRCTCARRLIIPDSTVVGEAIIQVLERAIANIKIGAYQDNPEPFMGPVISEQAVEKVLYTQQQLINAGGKVLIEAKSLKSGTGFISPGLLDVTAIQERADTECFGPLLQVIRVKDFDAAIIEANNTAYGLSAGIFTDNAELYQQFYQASQAGIVNWNRQLTGASGAAPFGGIGHSGNHRPSAYYAADYCAYPVASMQAEKMILPEQLTPGITL